MAQLIFGFLIVAFGIFLFLKGFEYINSLQFSNRYTSFLIKGILYLLLFIATGLFAVIYGVILAFLGTSKTK